MGTFQAIIAGVKVLFTLIEIFRDLGEIKKKKEFSDWLDDLGTAVKDMKNADDLRKQFDAAARLTDLTRRLR